jgi:acetate kinase
MLKEEIDCQLALAMNAYQMEVYWFVCVNGLIGYFPAGIGENSSYIRKLVCTDMEFESK